MKNKKEIETIAYNVLKTHNLKSLPVNPVVLAKKLGFKVNNAKFSENNISGMIAKRGNDVMLLVNQDDPPYRKRFTIAHELGHHFLHLIQDGEFIDGEENLFRESPDNLDKINEEHRKEIEANIFAAALLMPEEEVRREWDNNSSLEILSKSFNVSLEAMGYRLNKLGIL